MKVVPIPGFNNYFAGVDGNIYSNYFGKLKKLKPNIQTTGKYYIVNIKKNGDTKYKTQRVHRLICIAFYGNRQDLTVSHIDGNWKNNKPENLKWESYSENHQRKKLHGTDDVGVKNSRAKIDLRTLVQIRKLLKQGKLTHKQIGERFNLGRVFITKIANGHRYKGQGLC